MPQVKIKDKYQVTIPARIRNELGLEVGDLLEADVQGDQIVLKPQLVVDKAKAWERFRAALRRSGKKNRDMDDEELIRDVLEAIQEVRKAKHA